MGNTKPTETPLNTASILIVEDEYILGCTIKDMVLALGYHVQDLTTSLTEASAAIAQQKPDLVLLDFQLGKEKGSDLANTVLNPEFIPFIYITSHTSGSQFEEAKKTKPYGFLSKPIQKQILYNAIEIALYKAENEDIKKEKQRSETLLSISEAIATVKNRKELFTLIFKKINNVLPFDDVGLVVLDEASKKWRDLAVSDEYRTTAFNKELTTLGLGQFMEKDALLDHALSNTDILSIEKILTKFQDNPMVPIMAKHGFKEVMVTPLKVGNKIIGTLSFNSLEGGRYAPTQFPLFEGIACQIALAVSNIMAKEEISRLNEALRLERDYLIEEVKTEHNFEEIIGNSALLREVFKNVEMVAGTDATVLVEGETGTGKELIARAIHNRSNRRHKPIIKVNCAALPKELIESELFGHEKGSFTGAFERRIGKFELAHNGSLFLDEIGEMPLDLQAKLLRAIQEKEIERLGGKEVINVDVRIIAATNRNLNEEVDTGNFRSDLYYRLNVFPIRVPALRERKEDIPLLATYFAQKYCRKFNTRFKGIKEKALQELLEYDWPGNVRELENLVEQACILNQGQALSWARELVAKAPKKTTPAHSHKPLEFDIAAIKKEQETLERNKLLSVLKKTNWRIRGDKGAAKLLNMKPTSLEYRIKKLGLR